MNHRHRIFIALFSPGLREQVNFDGKGGGFFAVSGYNAKANRQHLKKHCFNPTTKYREQETSGKEKPKQLPSKESKKCKRCRGLTETVSEGAEIGH